MDFAAETESALGISAVSADPVSTALQLSDNSYGKSSNIKTQECTARADNPGADQLQYWLAVTVTGMCRIPVDAGCLETSQFSMRLVHSTDDASM